MLASWDVERDVGERLAQMDELLKDRIAALKAAREAAMAALDRAKSATHPIDGVSPLAVDRFVEIALACGVFTCAFDTCHDMETDIT